MAQFLKGRIFMLKVNFLGQILKNPVIAASGTFGFGIEYSDIFDVSKLGGIASKGLTLEKRYGNEGVRLHECEGAMLNSIGLQNPGVEHFIHNELPAMQQIGTKIFANLGGSTIESYEQGVLLLNDTAVDFIELNISCPNVKAGGIAYGIKSASAKEIVERVRSVCKKPLIVKLSPNAENIVDMAQTCQEAGADALSLINTITGMAIDTKARKAVFANTYAGLSGPAIKPIALRMVHQVCKAVKIPVIGLGGICTGGDVIEFIMAGATAIQVGTANFIQPNQSLIIVQEIEAFMLEHNISSLQEIRGIIA